MADIVKVDLYDPESGKDFIINSNGRLEISIEEDYSGGVVSLVNSSTTLLGIGGVFTGTALDVTDYSSIFINVFSDVASAVDGLSIEFSSDSTNWDEKHLLTVSANSSLDSVYVAHAQYFRIVYINGGTGQSTFRLQTICKLVVPPLMSNRIGTTINDEESAALVRAVLSAKKPNGDYVNIQSTAGGNLKVSIEEYEAEADDLGSYKISDIDADSSPNYYGFLRADGAWYILKETLVTGDDTYRYVKGASGYNWSNRVAESYVTFDSAF